MCVWGGGRCWNAVCGAQPWGSVDPPFKTRPPNRGLTRAPAPPRVHTRQPSASCARHPHLRVPLQVHQLLVRAPGGDRRPLAGHSDCRGVRPVLPQDPTSGVHGAAGGCNGMGPTFPSPYFHVPLPPMSPSLSPKPSPSLPMSPSVLCPLPFVPISSLKPYPLSRPACTL